MGSPEKSAGRAALSSWALVDIGITGGTGGARGCLSGAGGTALCLGVLGVWGIGVEGTMVLVLLLNRRNERRFLIFCYARRTLVGQVELTLSRGRYSQRDTTSSRINSRRKILLTKVQRSKDKSRLPLDSREH